MFLLYRAWRGITKDSRIYYQYSKKLISLSRLTFRLTLDSDFWMHQLFGVTKAPRFDEPTFEAKLKEMVKTVEEKSTVIGKTQTNSEKLKVEFLYFKSCPSHKQALENLKAALRETRTKAELILINVDSPEKAEKVGFQGSPSIRVNGKDLEGRNEEANFSCRLYRINGKPTPIPSKEFIEEKLVQYK